jgi:hypothetical protein
VHRQPAYQFRYIKPSDTTYAIWRTGKEKCLCEEPVNTVGTDYSSECDFEDALEIWKATSNYITDYIQPSNFTYNVTPRMFGLKNFVKTSDSTGSIELHLPAGISGLEGFDLNFNEGLVMKEDFVWANGF